MRTRQIKEIFKKEVLDTLRDRRTIFMMIVLPLLLYPGLMILMTELATSQKARMEQKIINVALVGVPENSLLRKLLQQQERIRIVDSKDPLQEVRDGKIHFLIEMPVGWMEKLKRMETIPVQLHYDQSSEDATTNIKRLQEVLQNYDRFLLEERLKQKALPLAYVKPLEIQEVNVASGEKMGGFLIGRFLPMLMVIMILAGSMYPAIDMTAGEKERGTLETILTSPTTRTEIVLGKFLTVTLMALVTGLLNLGSMWFTFAHGIISPVTATVQIKIPAPSLLIIILCLFPLAIFFSGIMMTISTFARSFKEAQNLLTPAYLLAAVPAMVSVIPGIQLEGFWLTMPIANVILLFKELMLGIFDWNHIMIVLFCVTFLAGASLFIAIHLFGREEVLFGEVSSFGLSWKPSNIVAKPFPHPSEVTFYTLVSLALILYVAIPLQVWNLVWGLVLTELLIFLALPVVFASYLKLNFRQTFRLQLPAPRFVVSTLLMFAGFELVASTLMYLQNLIFPIPQSLQDYMQKFMQMALNLSFPVALVVIAFLPALCEEITFRGMILSGFLSQSRSWMALTITAALFGVFHLSLYRFFLIFVLGLGISYMVWKSGSILTGMLLHFLNNGMAVLFTCYPHLDYLGLLQMNPSPSRFMAGLAFITLAIFIANVQKRQKNSTLIKI